MTQALWLLTSLGLWQRGRGLCSPLPYYILPITTRVHPITAEPTKVSGIKCILNGEAGNCHLILFGKGVCLIMLGSILPEPYISIQ